MTAATRGLGKFSQEKFSALQKYERRAMDRTQKAHSLVFNLMNKKIPLSNPFLVDLPAGLSRKVLVNISLLEAGKIRKKMILHGAIFGISAVSLVPAVIFFLEDIFGSGFMEALSLIFMDGGVILDYWRETGLFLLESMPAGSLALVFASLFVIFLAGPPFIFDLKRMMESRRMIMS